MAVAGPSKEEVNRLIWASAELASLRIYRDNVFNYSNGFYPKPFNRGEIGLMKREKKYAVSALMLYRPGFEFLKKRTGGGMGDYDHGLEVPYQRLEEFVRDRELHTKCMQKVFNREKVTETAVTLAMAVHLFGKLVPEGALTVDKYMKGLKDYKEQCPCGCGAGFHAGDTGIGLAYAWHGFPDMLVHDVPVEINPKYDCDDEEEEEEGESDNTEHRDPDKKSEQSNLDEPPEKKCRRDSGEQSEESEKILQQDDDKKFEEPHDKFAGVAVEVKKETLKNELVIGQMVATTITNSYAQVTAKPELGSKFLPSICCSKSGTIIYAYNVDEDLFVNNFEEEVFFEYKYSKQKLNLVMIVEIWLALNIYLTGAESSDIKPWIMKSRFQELDDASIYEAAQLKASKFEEPSDMLSSEFFSVRRTEIEFWPGEKASGHALEKFVKALHTN